MYCGLFWLRNSCERQLKWALTFFFSRFNKIKWNIKWNNKSVEPGCLCWTIILEKNILAPMLIKSGPCSNVSFDILLMIMSLFELSKNKNTCFVKWYRQGSSSRTRSLIFSVLWPATRRTTFTGPDRDRQSDHNTTGNSLEKWVTV